MDKVRLAVEELPELETEVAISGSVKQQEVGGRLLPRHRGRHRDLRRNQSEHRGPAARGTIPVPHRPRP